MHTKLLKGTRGLVFNYFYTSCTKAASLGSGETAHMGRLFWPLNAPICDKYRNLKDCLKF